MIIVTGATGTLGRQIVEHLFDLVPVERIGVSVRDPSQAGHFANVGVRVRHGDFARPDTLASAFEGGTQLLMISSNARAFGGDTAAEHRQAIDAAKAAGIGRIVYTSHMGVSASSAFSPMHDHAATETMLRDSGVAWTALRNGFYASSVLMYLGDTLATGRMQLPEDGKVSWTAHADLAAAAAQILAQDGMFDGPTPPLTASEALDFADIAALLSRIHGRTITRETISDADYEAKLSATGMPPAVVEIVTGMYRAAHAGEFAAVDPALSRLIGRAPARVETLLQS